MASRIIAATSNAKRMKNQGRLRELAKERAGEVEVLCAHDLSYPPALRFRGVTKEGVGNWSQVVTLLMT